MEATLRKAARRIAIDLAARRAAVGLLIGAGAGLAALLVDRVALLDLPAAVFGGIVGLGLVAGIAAALLRLPGTLEVAVRLDRGLGLKDRLGTAETVRAGKVFGEFAELAWADAARAARGLDVAPATPIRLGGLWPAGLALTALLAAGIAWVPPLRRPPVPPEEAARVKEQREQIARTIDEAVAKVDPSLLDEGAQRDVEALDAIARQLGGADPAASRTAEARDESAARMETLAERMGEEAERNLQALDEATKRVASFEPADPGRGANPGPKSAEALSELLKKLGRGELEQAAQQAKELESRTESMSPEERRELARELDSLAEHLRDKPPQEEEQESAERQKMREALEDLGLDKQDIEQVLEKPDDRQLQETLEKHQADPETARQLARDLEELRKEDQARQSAESIKERLADAAEKTARDLDQQQEEREQSQPPAHKDEPGQKEQQPSQEGQKQQPQPGQQEQPGQQGQPEQSQPQPRKDQEGQKEQQPSQEGQQQQPQQGQQERPEQQGQPEQSQPQPRKDGQGPKEQQPSQEGQEQQQQQEQPAQQGEQRSDKPGDGRQGLQEAIRQLQRTEKDSLDRRAASERLKEAARQIADNLTEEEQQKLAEQWAPSSGTRGSPRGASPDSKPPGADETTFEGREDVDLRGGPQPDQPATQWLDPNADDLPPLPPATGAAGRAAVERARQDAEQAVEKSAVPPRYHRFIRRYFGRLDETTSPTPAAAPSPNPPAAP